jgi:hypothetical protein
MISPFGHYGLSTVSRIAWRHAAFVRFQYVFRCLCLPLVAFA